MSTKMNDEDWRHTLAVFRACLPRRGRKANDDRRFLEALHFFTVENVRWRALPDRFGPWSSVWKRFDRLSKAGVFEAFFDALASMSSSAHLSRFVRTPSANSEILLWIDNYSRALALPELASRTLSSRRRVVIEMPMHSAHWKAWRSATIGSVREPAPNLSPLQKRLDWLAKACSLDAGQSRVLGLLARVTRTPEVSRLVEAINDRFDAEGRDLYPFLETSSERVELSPVVDSPSWV
jgi:transposase